jgi:hypothetical protein
MSNISIAQRIFEIVAAYERGDVNVIAITQSIELHESALEGISREVRDRLHSLSVEIIYQDVDDEMLGWTASREALNEIKLLLASIV